MSELLSETLIISIFKHFSNLHKVNYQNMMSTKIVITIFREQLQTFNLSFSIKFGLLEIFAKTLPVLNKSLVKTSRLEDIKFASFKISNPDSVGVDLMLI